MADRICSVEGCERPYRSNGYCKLHVTRWERHGDPLIVLRIKKHDDPICTVDGCGREKHGGGLCDTHYGRMRHHGSLDLLEPSRTDPTMRVCLVEGCGRKHYAMGYCQLHRERVKRHGDPLVVLKSMGTGDDITYVGAHRRVRVARGRADNHDCVDCGDRAAEWSYNHCDPDERRDEQRPYSPRPEYYEPRCRSCHQKFDQEVNEKRR